MEIKKGKSVVGFILICIIFVYFFINTTNSIFEPLIYNNAVTIDSWDMLQIILGYYTPESQIGITYLDLKSMTQLSVPILIQMTGIFCSIYFLQIPLSFHTFVKTRIKNTSEYLYYFLKKSILLTFFFVITLGVTLLIIITSSSFDLSSSSFSYQTGNINLSIVAYLVNLFLMIVSVSLFIFWGYIKSKGVITFSITFLSLVLLNIADRVIPHINLILFDAHYYFVDSIVFWCILIIATLCVFHKVDLYQEEYND